jgi:predicted acetyltransferase
MKVIPIVLEHLAAFQDMLLEYESTGEDYSLYSKKLGEWWNNPAEFVSFWQRLARKPLPELSLVQSDFFWLMEDSCILGDVRFRHNLNERLERDGGHVGYCVRPSQRNKGLATILLKFALDHARALDNEKVLLTCDEGNLASIRVIEKNGGIFADQSILDDGSVNNRYWIDLKDVL